MRGKLVRTLRVAALTVALAGIAALPARAGMVSTQIGKHLCKTVGGGKFVDIPGFPGEKIDRRLLRDIRWMRRKYRIFITDGFSTSPVHSANGEHPLGLALDIVPYWSEGGRWGLIGDLAHWAEPVQNQPRMPFRWVGYNGDAGHGRGHHLHLSYAHSRHTRFGRPVRKVFTRICPKPPADTTSGSGGGGGSGDGSTGGISAKIGKLAPVVVERH
jgi:hypothetical protein